MNKKSEFEINERINRILEYIKKHQFCSKDQIFTISGKSKLTNTLIETLVSKKIIRIIYTRNGKIRYYHGNPDEPFDLWLKWMKLTIEQAEYFLKKFPTQHAEIDKKIIEFYRVRTRVLEAEGKTTQRRNAQGKKHPHIDFSDTMEIMKIIELFQKNPTPLNEMVLKDQLQFAIKDDKYYLKHQLHSKPRIRQYPFQRAKERGARRSVFDLLAMREKGREDFSLKESDFKKHMKKITDDPSNWINRYYAEKKRTLYQYDLNQERELWQKINNDYLKKLKPGIPRWKEKRKLLLATIELESKYPPSTISIIKFLRTTLSIMTNEEKKDFLKPFPDRKAVLEIIDPNGLTEEEMKEYQKLQAELQKIISSV